MLIGEVVKQTRLSKDTIRFYEKQGLIKVSRKERRDNNYKEYSPAVLEKLYTIKRLKHFGFTLDEIGDLLALMDENMASCNNVEQMNEEKVRMLDEKIAELIKVRGISLKGLKECRTGCCTDLNAETCTILTKD